MMEILNYTITYMSIVHLRARTDGYGPYDFLSDFERFF